MAPTPVDRDALATKVREARKKLGLSQAALAEAADLSNETVSRIERGAYDASLATAVALAEALGVSLDYLVGRHKNPQGRPRTSQTVAKLAEVAERLPPAAQRILLRLAEMIVAPPKRGRKA